MNNVITLSFLILTPGTPQLCSAVLPFPLIRMPLLQMNDDDQCVGKQAYQDG